MAASVTTEHDLALKNERVTFTGKLASMSRRQACEIVRKAGGRANAAVTRATTLVVVGMDGWPLLRNGQLSNKLQQAESVRRGRSRLRVWSEQQFLEKVGLKDEYSPASKSLSAEQVCELVDVTPEVLQKWEFLGLVRSHDGLFDFQDVVSLQTIAALIAEGADLRTIAQSVRSLSRVLPGTDRPLAQLKLLANQDSLVAEIGGSLVAPSGQFLLRFENAEGEAEDADAFAGSFLLPVADRSAQEWFDIASDCEDAADWEQATSAYRQALAMQPAFPEANFNLANVLRSAGKTQAAEERYRVALEQDRSLAEAWYNLADVLDERGELDEAISCLRSAVEAAPQYADAHYNLACCCQRAGLRTEAIQHFKHYVKLDPLSEWAALARQELSA